MNTNVLNRRIIYTPILSVPVAGGYTGPGDVTGWGTAYGYWGLRAYNAIKAAALSNLIDVADQSLANPLTCKCNASGDLDLGPINAWVTANSVTTIRITKFYDQAGSQDLSAIGGTQTANLLRTGVGTVSKPVAYFDGGNSAYIAAAASPASAQPITASAIARFETWAAQGNIVSEGDFNCMWIVNHAAATVNQAANIGNSSDYSGVPDTAWASYVSVLNDASSTMNIVNTSVNTGVVTTSTSPGTSGISGTHKVTIGAMTDAGAVKLLGHVLEVIIKAGGVSSTDQASLIANQRLYGGY